MRLRPDGQHWIQTLTLCLPASPCDRTGTEPIQIEEQVGQADALRLRKKVQLRILVYEVVESIHGDLLLGRIIKLNI